MNQAEVSKLMSQLRVAIPLKPRRLRGYDGPEGRLMKLRKTVTALVKHERIELNYDRAHEARGYMERVRKPTFTPVRAQKIITFPSEYFFFNFIFS